MIAKKNETFSKAADILEAISRDKKNRALYEAEQKMVRDEKSRILDAKLKGLEEGIHKGKQQGSLARNDFPQEAKVDTLHKPAKMKTNPSLADRLKAQTCEWCGRKTPDVVMHQVRALSELDDNQPWNIFMKKINRKTMVVCPGCHEMIHNAD